MSPCGSPNGDSNPVLDGGHGGSHSGSSDGTGGSPGDSVDSVNCYSPHSPVYSPPKKRCGYGRFDSAFDEHGVRIHLFSELNLIS